MSIAYVMALAGMAAFVYLAVTWIVSAMYVGRTGDREETVTFVLTTIAESRNEETLFEVIHHHISKFPNCDLYVVIDEGAELQDELVSADGFETVIVPESFNPSSIAKGRAQEYFCQEYVSDDEWYVFIDDDAKVTDREFLREIPYYDERDFVAANGILWPRLGDSKISYIIDHMRTFFDSWILQGVTGTLQKPYLGLHGEFLVIRGNVLNEIGFREKSIVEDFALANRLVENNYKTWQSATGVSILSPHSLTGFLKQRRRWFKGKLSIYRRCTPMVTLLSLLLDFIWFSGILITWAAGAILFAVGTPLPALLIVFPAIAAVVFSTVYLVGIGRLAREHGWLNLLYILVFPIYATIEHIAAWYALLTDVDGFEVINK